MSSAFEIALSVFIEGLTKSRSIWLSIDGVILVS